MRMILGVALLVAGAGVAAGGAAAAAGGAVAAKPPAAACAALDDAALPRELRGFNGHLPMVASGATLAAGDGVRLQLVRQAQAGFAVPVAAHPVAEPWAGTLRLRVAHAGVYRVAAGAHAWIDVVPGSGSGGGGSGGGGGRALETVTDAHGPACSGVAKILDFRLAAGTYDVRLSNAPAERMTVMVAARR